MTKIEMIANAGLMDTFDRLYANSKNGDNARKLFPLITGESNIRLAIDFAKQKSWQAGCMDSDSVESQVLQIQEQFQDYRPRHVDFSTWVMEQAVFQVLEPWCEARFHPHNYGFRPERCSYHALSRFVSLINVGKMYYTVSLDFEDLTGILSHEALNRALWNIGIHDKCVLSFISRMLQYRTDGKGLPKDSPLTPLLLNVMLNELDWWVSSQWETLKVDGNLRYIQKKPTNLKSGYLVRYGTEFRILCRSYDHAVRWTHALDDFLKHRFYLDNGFSISVFNLMKKDCDFVGFSIDVIQKGTARYGFVARTHVSPSMKEKLYAELKGLIKTIQHDRSPRAISAFNQKVRWAKKRYQFGTHVYCDFDDIGRALSATIRVRLRDCRVTKSYCEQSSSYKKENPGLQPETKISVVNKIPLHTINAVKRRNPLNFPQARTIYSVKGREQKLQ